jgi:superoxide dismutase, Fe-Mn family
MSFELPALPYALNALEPHISAETLEYHHGKHHAAYVANLNKMIVGTEFESMNLEEIIKNSSGGVFNNAAQVWNHSFYWNCMAANGGGEPQGELAALIEQNFGSFEQFQEQFTQAGMTRFGSGWAWLVKNTDGSLEICSTPNAENPLTAGKTPLLVCDVWEHAYYIDTRNNRGQYISNFWQLVNWSFVSSQLG